MPVARITTKSKFKIDVSFWEKQGRDFRREVYDALCDECKSMYSLEELRLVDHIDPQTGEIIRMDVLLDCASDICGNSSDYVSPKMPLTRAIFRALIAGGNMPQSAEEIYERIKKSTPQFILKELMSTQMEDEGIVNV